MIEKYQPAVSLSKHKMENDV